MKSIIYILFSVYFIAGSTLLPMGNFSTIGEVADMYRHCKATEDCDMGLEDFITEHVLNLRMEDFFEAHREEKEHQPTKSSPYQHISGSNIQIVHKSIDRFVVTPSIALFFKNIFLPNNDRINVANFASAIFRPPVITSSPA